MPFGVSVPSPTKILPAKSEKKPEEAVFHNVKMEIEKYFEAGEEGRGSMLYQVNMEKPKNPVMEAVYSACKLAKGQSAEIALALWCTKQMVPNPETVNWPVVGMTAVPFSSNKCLQFDELTDKFYASGNNAIKWNFRSYDEIKTILQNPSEDSKKIKQSEEDYKWARLYSGWYDPKRWIDPIKEEIEDENGKKIYNPAVSLRVYYLYIIVT